MNFIIDLFAGTCVPVPRCVICKVWIHRIYSFVLYIFGIFGHRRTVSLRRTNICTREFNWPDIKILNYVHIHRSLLCGCTDNTCYSIILLNYFCVFFLIWIFCFISSSPLPLYICTNANAPKPKSTNQHRLNARTTFAHTYKHTSVECLVLMVRAMDIIMRIIIRHNHRININNNNNHHCHRTVHINSHHRGHYSIHRKHQLHHNTIHSSSSISRRRRRTNSHSHTDHKVILDQEIRVTMPPIITATKAAHSHHMPAAGIMSVAMIDQININRNQAMVARARDRVKTKTHHKGELLSCSFISMLCLLLLTTHCALSFWIWFCTWFVNFFIQFSELIENMSKERMFWVDHLCVHVHWGYTLIRKPWEKSWPQLSSRPTNPFSIISVTPAT